MLTKRFAQVTDAMLSAPEPQDEVMAYDFAEASFTCPGEIRVGGVTGDGGKFVCFTRDRRIRSAASMLRPCVVYSLGSQMNFMFEEDVFRLTDCHSYTFDPTVAASQAQDYLAGKGIEFVHFYERAICVDQRVQSIKGKEYTCHSVKHLMQEFGHSHIDLLKVDIEGSEFEVLPDLLNSPVRPSQILVETHGTDWDKIKPLFDRMHHAGYVLFHKERNHWGCKGFHCLEFAFASRDYLCATGWDLPASITCSTDASSTT